MITIEGMMNKHQNLVENTRSSHSLYLHKNSQIIAKVKPEIRIVHIFPPEIIKTDVENFRDLVQRLTGKPSGDHNNKKRMVRPTRPRKAELQPSRFSKLREQIKEEGEIWGGGISQNTGGFLGGLADLDGFMQDVDHFQMLPVDANSNMGFIGGAQIV